VEKLLSAEVVTGNVHNILHFKYFTEILRCRILKKF